MNNSCKAVHKAHTISSSSSSSSISPCQHQHWVCSCLSCSTWEQRLDPCADQVYSPTFLLGKYINRAN